MKRSIGIDIGTSSIKLVELEDKRPKPELTKCGFMPVAAGDKESALKELLSRVKLSSRRVNVSLSGPSVIVRYIEMPPMNKNELHSAIKFEAEKYIPFKIEESIIDCAPLAKTSSASQRVLLVAAKKTEVSNLLKFFKGAGLEANVIDIDSFAFLNAFHRSSPQDKDINSYALINMGERFSNVNIVAKGEVCFTRDILWGGNNITLRIKDALGVSMDDAERLKKNPAEKKEEVKNVISSILERFTSQVRMSFDYFESQFASSVQRVYISGGSSYLFNAPDFLKDELGVDVMMWNPFEGIKLMESIEEIERFPGLFAVAVGLALRK